MLLLVLMVLIRKISGSMIHQPIHGRKNPMVLAPNAVRAVAFVYNNAAYVVTGTNNGTLVNDFWKYDGTSWTELRKIANISTDSYDDDYTDIVRSNAAAFVMGDTAFISTGENSGYISKTWAYIISNDTWIRRTAFEGAARSGAVGFAVKNRGYIVCGKSSSQYFDDVWEFHPDEAYNAND